MKTFGATYKKKISNILLNWITTHFYFKDGELPVLPLSVYGAVVMAHSDVSDEYSSPNQFFFYRYDKSFVSSI